MSFGPEMGMAVVLGVAGGVVTAPLAIIGKLPIKATLNTVVLGVLLLLASGILISIIGDYYILDVLTLKAEISGKAAIRNSYILIIWSTILFIAVTIRKLFLLYCARTNS